MTDDLVLEHLKAIQTTLARHGEQLTMLIDRVGRLEKETANIHRGMADLHGDFAGLSVRVDSIDARIERVERRLDLIPVE